MSKLLPWCITLFLMMIASCSKNLFETNPEIVTDTSDVKITCDASQGNKGLLDYSGTVYVHLGLITNKSLFEDDWRYVKFNWGSRQPEALAIQVGENQWTYQVKNIRQFFQVPKDEQIIKIAVLFRSGGCLDAYCKVLRNTDGGNIYIPVHDQTVIAQK
jgi:hypothetical protein